MPYAGTLTDPQLEAIRQDRDEWMACALSTQRCDRPAAEAAVDAAYRAAGLEPPSIKVWMDSPLGGVAAKWGIHQLRGQLGDQLRGQLWDQLRGQLWDQLGGQLWDQLRGQLWDQLGDQLGGQLGDQLRGQLWDQLGGQLRGQLRGQLWDQLRGQLNPWSDAYWLSLYGQALHIAGLPRSDRLDTLTQAVRSVGCWWPMRGAAILTDRPVTITRDNQGRLHHETGPALAYADGWGGCWWHGVPVPADLVEGDGWTTDRIMRERNTEIRRCAIEKLGWDRFVHDANLSRVGPTVPDPGNPGRELALYDVPAAIYDEPVRVLICENGSPDRDGTRRRFGLTVPADVADPISAAAWTYDCSPDEYAGLARRT